eukprot:XP_014043195.1 PREDICTED: myotubularin-related protein 14-like [Salmo salar]
MMAAFPSVSGSLTASGLMISGRKTEEIADLIDLFSKTQYRAKEVTPRVETIEKRCLELFGRDYKYSVIHNANGEVCGHYPRQMVFLEYECTELRKDGYRTYLRYLNTSSLRLCLQILDLLDVQSLFPQSLFPQLLSKHIGGGGPREGPWILSTNVL